MSSPPANFVDPLDILAAGVYDVQDERGGNRMIVDDVLGHSMRVWVPNVRLRYETLTALLDDLTRAAGGRTEYQTRGVWYDGGYEVAEDVTVMEFYYVAPEYDQALSILSRLAERLLWLGEKVVMAGIDGTIRLYRD